MFDRKTWRPIIEHWLAIQRGIERATPGEQELHCHMEDIFLGMIDARLLLGEHRKRTAEAIRELRALSKEVGVPAARPLPRSCASQPRPDTGAYGIQLSYTLAGPCVGCGSEVGVGPVGWHKRAPGPLCDICLLKASPPLAAILSAVNMMREAGEIECQRDEDEATLGGMILTTGWLFERSPFKDYPLRDIDLESSLLPLLRRLDALYHVVEGEDGGDWEDWEDAVVN